MLLLRAKLSLMMMTILLGVITPCSATWTQDDWEITYPKRLHNTSTTVSDLKEIIRRGNRILCPADIMFILEKGRPLFEKAKANYLSAFAEFPEYLAYFTKAEAEYRKQKTEVLGSSINVEDVIFSTSR